MPNTSTSTLTPVEEGFQGSSRFQGNRFLRLLYLTGVFLAGFLCILVGFALVVLPGPLTIPPILLGLWVWSREFKWAHALFERAQLKARQAWKAAKRRPVQFVLTTLLGLLFVGVGAWLVGHYGILGMLLSWVKALAGHGS